MAWFALVVAVLAVVHFAIAYPGFRRVLVWCGAGALALVAGVVALLAYGAHHNEQERQVARAKIAPSQIHVEHARLSLPRDRYSYGEVMAVVTNKSRHELARVELRVSVTDCSPTCRTVGEGVASESVAIPPGQSRAFRGSVPLYGLPELSGGWAWSYVVAGVEAGRS